MRTGLLVIGTLYVFVAFVLLIVSLRTTYWLQTTNEGWIGLYQICYLGGQCEDLYSSLQPMDTVRAVRAMVILGITFGLLSLVTITVFLVVKICMDRTLDRLPMLCFVLSCIACFFGLVGVAIYGSKLYAAREDVLDDYHLGYSFSLCICGALLFPVGGIYVKFGGKSEANTDPETQHLLNPGVPSMSFRERIIQWLS